METQEMNDRPVRAARPQARRRWLAGLGAALAIGAVSLSMARAQAPAGEPGGQMGAFGRGEGFMAFRIQRLLDRVGATDSQKSQIKAIWEGLRPQLKALHQQHAQLRQQIGQVISAPTIDTAQVEKLRQQSVQVMDKLSSVITQGVVSSAQVLTPDQRKQALEEMQKQRQHHRRGPAGIE